MVENKEINDYWTNQKVKSLSSGTNDGTACRQLLPLPAQGTGANQRIGNNIKVVSGVLKLNLNLAEYDATFNPVGTPVEVRVMVFRDLQNTGTQNILASASFFDDIWRLNGYNVGPQGSKLDLMLNINDTHFRVLYNRVFKLGAASYSSTGPVGSAGYFDNSPMSRQITINWGKWVKKQLKFSDGGAYPTNDNLYIVYFPIRGDGASSSGYKLIETHGLNFIKYEDA